MIVDGKKIAAELYGELAMRAKSLGHAPRLGIVVAGHDPVIESFVRVKSRAAKRLGVAIHRLDLSAEANTEDVITGILDLAKKVDGVVVQLPLPNTVDVNAALAAIPDDKDVDGISTATGDHFVEAPVALSVIEILRRANIEPKGKNAVVVGAGRLVGSPTFELLKKLGSEVSKVSLESGSLEEVKTADIVVCGAGNPGFIKPDMLKQGVALIDAGTSEQGGKVVGDCDPACADIASVFTPVPGGVGPVAVAMIFKNLLDLIYKEIEPRD